MILRAAILALAITGAPAMSIRAHAIDSAFPKTPEGTVEIKKIPASTVLVTSSEGSYFDRANDLFSRLFRYIRKNEVAMTVPVEAGLDRASMRFYVGPGDASRPLSAGPDVEVLALPARTVVSLGARGSYTKANVTSAVSRLDVWLAGQPTLARTGMPYAVFWNSPFVPGFLKRFEVHVEVTGAP